MKEIKWKITNSNILTKFKNALEGITFAYETDKSVRILIVQIIFYIFITILFVPSLLNKSIGISLVLLCLSTELINTAVETTVDRIGLEYNLMSKHAKDLAAGATFIVILIVLIFTIFTIVHTYSYYKKWKKKNKNKKKNIFNYIKSTFKVII